MSNWFECKVKYHKHDEASGKVKKVSEPFLLDAVSFTDAEARIIKEIEQYVKDEFVVTNISKAKYTDVFHYEDTDKWFKCKVTYTDVDQKSGKEKKFTNMMLVSASNAKEAYERIEESLNTMIIPFEIPSVILTSIVDVIPYHAEEESTDKTFSDNLAALNEVFNS